MTKIRELQKSKTKHGMSKTKVYWAYMACIQRCYNPKRFGHEYYADLEVCARWLESFQNFYEDMGDPPSKFHSLDRIDGSKGYCKSNCRWATQQEQGSNKVNIIYIKFKNEVRSLREWAEKLNISYHCIYSRLRKGWSAEDILTRPVQYHIRRT